MNRDIDNEAQGLAAEAAARQNAGRGGGGGAAPQPVDVRIDWSGHGAARAAVSPCRDGDRRTDAGARRAFGRVDRVERRRRRRTRRRSRVPIRTPACTSSTSRADKQTRVPPAPQTAGGGGGGRGRGGAAGGFGGGGNMVFARDGRTLYFRSGTGLYAAAD